jgi:UDP-N-acetylmuramoylalanine-D-glutamate ligase
VRYRLRGIPDVIRAFGLAEVVRGLVEAAWPLLFGLAQAHRRTLLRWTRLVAVVGTYGKTTTARALSAVLLGA